MRAAIVLVALVAGSPRRAEACSCSQPPPPCEAFWQAPVVFTGKVASMQQTKDHVQLATLDVDQTFRGTVGKQVVIQGGGMCGAMFRDGESYFVYAHQDGGKLYASLCGRTRKLADAAEDLSYVKALPVRKAGLIEGTVVIETDRARVPRAGVKVVATGQALAKLQTTTDAKGAFRIDAPIGSYELDVVGSDTRVRWGRLPKVGIPDPAACARREIVVVWNGRIRGTINGQDGKPVANVTVSAHATDGRQNWRLSTKTDASGTYEILEVQAGRYVVAVNHVDEGGPDAGSPIPTTFYPGVATAPAAKTIEMKQGGVVGKIDFKVAKPLVVFTVSGTVKKDGTPIAKQHVNFDTALGPQYGRRESAVTDTQGKYAFRNIAGADIKIEVCRPDAGPKNYETACRVVKKKLDRDLVIDIEYPKP